jgi:hypothetical protein
MDISVIIPTTAKELRGPYLVAALDSLFAQSAHRAMPIVVVNGTSYVPDLLRALQSDKRLRVIYREEPGEMAALAAGRRIVDTEYFGVLDDDDLYLPNAFAIRVAALQKAPSADAVITNGYCRTAAGESLLLDNFAQISADPLAQLMHRNWMTPPGVLFRTASVGADIFAEAPTMLEYTYFGLRIASAGKLCFVDVPTFIKQDLLADAITRTNEYVTLQPRALEQMMRLALPHGVQRRLGQKLAASHHHVSAQELSQGHLGLAWRAHLKSLQSLYGLRYLSYTRHLLGPAVRAAMISGTAIATLLATAEAAAEFACG